MMKKFMIAFAAVAICGMSACASAPAVGTGVTSPGGVASGTVLDDKAMYAAETLYNVPAQAYVVASANNALTAAQTNEVKPLLVKAYAVLLTIRSAYAAGDAVGFQAQVTALSALSAHINALINVQK